MIGWLDKLLRCIPHRHTPTRVYTALGWAAKCSRWHCGALAHNEIGLLGGDNSAQFLDLRSRRSW